MNTENEREERGSRKHSTKADDGSSKDLKWNKRINSTPVWPTELPDVFSFPDSFFELQQDLNYSVLEYLIRMGYSDAAQSFYRELDFQREGGGGPEQQAGKPAAQAGLDTDDTWTASGTMDVGEQAGAGAADYQRQIKQQQCTMGLDTAERRKLIMGLILDGHVREAVSEISKNWPFFFDSCNTIKLRLLHLQAVEMIRDFFQTDVTLLGREQVEQMEESFFDAFVCFIRENLSDESIACSARFVKDMELTMGLLVYGKFPNSDGSRPNDDLPLGLQELLDYSLREKIASRVNRAILMYCDGVHLLDDRHSPPTAENQDPGATLPVGIDHESDMSEDSRLIQLVKLFVWSYGYSNSGVNRSVRLSKLAQITFD